MRKGPFIQVGRTEATQRGKEAELTTEQRPPHFCGLTFGVELRDRGERDNRLPLRETQHDHGGELTHRPQIKQLPACSGSEPDPQLGVCAAR